LKFQPYTPGGLLVIILGKFRDDLRDALEMTAEPPVQRGSLRLALHKLDSIEIGTVGGALMILRQARFTRIMDDPMLPQMLEAFVVTPQDDGADIVVSLEGDQDRKFKIEDEELDSPIVRLLVGAAITPS
jgi:hypothetical protein